MIRRKPNRPHWYYQTRIKGKTISISTGETDEAKALLQVPEMQRLALLRSAPAAVSKKLREAIVREIHRIEMDVGSGRADRVAFALENFAAWIRRDVPLQEITRETLHLYQRHRLQHVSADTVRLEIYSLRRLLRENGHPVDKPGQPISGRFTPNRAFTPEELEAIQYHAAPEYRTLYATLLATGARLAELVPSSRSRHVPLLKSEVQSVPSPPSTSSTASTPSTGLITIRTAKCKPGSRSEIRTVSICPELCAALKAQMDLTPGPHVFPRYCSARLSRTFSKVLARAGIPKINALDERATLHSFRHTYGTLAAEAVGNNQFLVQQMLGHKQISTTARYCHPQAPQIKNNPVAAMLKRPEGCPEGCPSGCRIVEIDFRKAG